MCPLRTSVYQPGCSTRCSTWVVVNSCLGRGLERRPRVAELGVGRLCLSSKELMVGRYIVVVSAPAATHTTLERARAWAATSPKAWGNMRYRLQVDISCR